MQDPVSAAGAPSRKAEVSPTKKELDQRAGCLVKSEKGDTEWPPEKGVIRGLHSACTTHQPLDARMGGRRIISTGRGEKNDDVGCKAEKALSSETDEMEGSRRSGTGGETRCARITAEMRRRRGLHLVNLGDPCAWQHRKPQALAPT